MKKIFVFVLLAFVMETEALDLIWQKQIHSNQVNQILFSKDLKNFISISDDKYIKITDIHTGTILDSFQLEYNPKYICYNFDKSELFITFRYKYYAAIKRFNADDYSFIDEILLSPLLDTSISTKNQDFIECHAIDLGNNVTLSGTGIYSYKSADHFYKGYLTKFNTVTGDTIGSVYSGGMITNLRLSPDKQHIVFSTLYRSSEYYSPNIYKETEKTELILTDINFSEFKILRNDFKQDYEYVDAEIFNAVNFSHDSKKIVTVTDEHHILAYDVESGQMIDSLYSCDCYGDMDVGFVYNNDNIVTGTNNGKVFIWNLVWDVNIDDIKLENSPYITSIACSDKHNLYAVGDYKGKLYLLTSREFSEIYNEDDDFIKIQQFDKIFKIINNSPSPVLVEIYNLLGEKIIERSFSQQENFINIEKENLSSGLYFMRIQAGTFSKIIKIII